MSEVTNIEDIYAEDAAEAEKLSNDKLKEVVRLANKQIELENSVALFEEELDKAKKLLLKHQTETLPEALSALGLKSLELEDGSKVTVKQFYSCTWPSDPGAAARATKWLVDNGFGALIKSNVICAFNKDSQDDVRELKALLVEKGFSFMHSENVHASTLKSFVKEQAELNKPVPADLFNTYIGNKSEIQKPKVKK